MRDGSSAADSLSLSLPPCAGALEEAAGTIARLDQALDAHPLAPAFLYRARLDAVRRQATADGAAIDPWHLAATLEGLRLRMDHALHIVDRGAIFAAARTAFGLHQWITTPDFDQEGEVQTAERHLAVRPSSSKLLSAAVQVRRWLEMGGTRPPIRAALIRLWGTHRLLRLPVPLTGPRALLADPAGGSAAWEDRFLGALAREARDFHQMLLDLERGWLAARARVAGRRSTSRAAAAVDVLAAAPLLSATSLAAMLGMSVKGATGLLDSFVADGIVVEVTHRAKRRLFGLAGLAPLRDGTTAPRRPQPGRPRGRPRRIEADPVDGPPPASLPPISRFERPAIDYGALEAAVAQCEQRIGPDARSVDFRPNFRTNRERLMRLTVAVQWQNVGRAELPGDIHWNQTRIWRPHPAGGG